MTEAWSLLIPYARSADVFQCPAGWDPMERKEGHEYHAGPMKPDGSVPAPVPGAGTVLAYCGQHTQRAGDDGYAIDNQLRLIGPIIFVREDGSAGKALGSQLEPWTYLDGRWYPGRPSHVGESGLYRFPGEPWPPGFGP